CLAPFYERGRALGAVFFEAAGWERPQWCASDAGLLDECGDLVTRREAGWERPQWDESNAGLLDDYGDRVTRREAEWESRWWSPIINAEHLAMRDRAG